MADHARRNREIARAISVNDCTVLAARKRLAAAGRIPPIPPASERPTVRAERELRADPARSDCLIAQLIGAERTTVRNVRHHLEAAGEIEPAPVRAHRPDPRPSAAKAAIAAGARSTRQIMDAARVSRSAAWKARIAWEAAHPDEPHAPKFRPGGSTSWSENWPATFSESQIIELNPVGQLYAAIGAGNLRAYTQGTDDVGHAALSN